MQKTVTKNAAGADVERVPQFVIEFFDFNVTYDLIVLKDEIEEAMERSLLTKPAIYPITRTEIRMKGYSSGLTSIEWNNAYQGTIPETVVVCMNLQEAADGKSEKNIFNFQPFGMKEFNPLKE